VTTASPCPGDAIPRTGWRAPCSCPPSSRPSRYAPRQQQARQHRQWLKRVTTQAQQQQLAQQQAKLQQQETQIKETQEEQAKHTAEIAQEKAAVAAVNKRFGELGEYNIWDKVEVLFANGKVTVDPEYYPKLLALCQKAQTVQGYVIQVKGYASAVGSAALNQKLSQERAANVTEYLEQKGGIPLTNILAPGAMGTSNQVAPDNTAEGQAENRRVVVMILQNKGIAGT